MTSFLFLNTWKAFLAFGNLSWILVSLFKGQPLLHSSRLNVSTDKIGITKLNYFIQNVLAKTSTGEDFNFKHNSSKLQSELRSLLRQIMNIEWGTNIKVSFIEIKRKQHLQGNTTKMRIHEKNNMMKK